jgi:hypothetical protein
MTGDLDMEEALRGRPSSSLWARYRATNLVVLLTDLSSAGFRDIDDCLEKTVESARRDAVCVVSVRARLEARIGQGGLCGLFPGQWSDWTPAAGSGAGRLPNGAVYVVRCLVERERRFVALGVVAHLLHQKRRRH